VRTTFFLVRHALKMKEIGDVPITSEGVLQAQSTARFFKDYSITGIVTSPLRRARETAEYISLTTTKEIQVDERLRERANWGDLPGQSFEQFVEMWDRCTNDPEYHPPVGDSSRRAGERMASALSDLANKSPVNSSIIIVTHGGLITDFLVNTIPADQLNKIYPEFAKNQSQLVPECSITKLIVKDGKYSVDYFSYSDHL